MKKKNPVATVIESPVGKLGIWLEENTVTAIKLLPEEADLISSPSTVTVENELKKYFKNPDHEFSLAIKTNGTPFQEKVWEALRKIPKGETMTYGELAKQLKTGPRPIGQACRTNPVILITPCHRVVGSQGMGGFAGYAVSGFTSAKEWLLRHEGVV